MIKKHKRSISFKMKTILCVLNVFHHLSKRTLWFYASKMKQRFIKPKTKQETNIEKVNDIFCILFKGNTHTNHRIFYFHGGGYLLKGRQNHYRVIHRFARLSGFDIVYIDYPLVPTETAPQIKDKTLAVVKSWITRDPTKINHLMGDSAGGNLALVMASELSSIQSIILISPWLDLSMENPEIESREKDETMFTRLELLEIAKRYANQLSLKDPTISPLYGNSLSHPTLMLAGEKDILYPDMCAFYKKHPQIHFHTYFGLPHDFVFITNTKETLNALETIKTFIHAKP